MGGVAIWVILRVQAPGPDHTSGSISLVWSSKHCVWLCVTGLQGHRVMIATDNPTVVSLYQQIGRDSVLLCTLSSSGSIFVATVTCHTIRARPSGQPQHDLRLPVQGQSADSHRM